MDSTEAPTLVYNFVSPRFENVYEVKHMLETAISMEIKKILNNCT